MQPKIEIFNDTGNSKEYHTLMNSIKHLTRFKPNTKYKLYNENFISLLKEKMGNPTSIDIDRFIQLGFTQKRFYDNDHQRIILLNEPLYHNGIIHDGLVNQRTPKYGMPNHQQTIILSNARSLSPDEFYAVCCHELGHAYGATQRNDNVINTGGLHCTIDTCVMGVPVFNEKTSSRIIEGKSLYCKECRDGIYKF